MAADPLSPKPSGLAPLARRISAWTTNSLLTLLILVAGLGFGRQVLQWWAADVPAPQGRPGLVTPAESLGNLAQLHTFRFGDLPWSLRRQSIVGDKQAAIERLRAVCRDVLANARPMPAATSPAAAPGAAVGRGIVGQPSASEEKFLAVLSKSTPSAQEPKSWQIYEFQGQFPMTVGLARPSEAAGQEVDSGPNLVKSGFRVVVWAVAMPVGDEGWTLYCFQPAERASETASALPEIPLPPGGHRSLSLQAVDGAGLTAFDGPYQPEAWKRFYADWFRRQAWPTATAWQPAGAAWYAKFAATDRGTVDIQFGPDGRGGLSGLLMIAPPISPGAK